MSLFEKIFGSVSDKEVKRITPIVNKVLSLQRTYEAMSDSELRGQTLVLKERLNKGETLDDILPDAFAVCREASTRVLGMTHFSVQILGGIVLHRGNIAEMKTGEGKTLVATLPVYLNALTGNGVHVVTVNEYLAARDAEQMGKIYKFLGLTVGLLRSNVPAAEHQAAYACDITYGTNNEFGFDYLRDNMAIYKENRVQRSHAYAIVDEVDSILIDEARTPLIISGAGEDSSEFYKKADDFAKRLHCVHVNDTNDKEDHDDEQSEGFIDGDYIVNDKAKTATLTKAGIQKAEQFFHVENLADADNIELQHYIQQAIKARGVMRRDVDYVVRNGEIIIVDEFTGRLMIGRRYNEGLHQAIEAKENVQIMKESKTFATVTFQNYFRMYNKLAGMTGTAKTEAAEFQEIYNLQVIEIPTNKPVIRIDNNDVIYKTEMGKFRAVINQIIACHEKGQPVLVGTISIEKSEQLSKMLKQRGVTHNVLNAKHHEREAEIIAQAGRKGAVTIATNMAGRGTDIMLGGNLESLTKHELKKYGFEEDVIEESNTHNETDNAAVLEAREKYQEISEKLKPQIAQEGEAVREAGGLYIIGTERHESRRIDNQLRGRSGRQGDPGETRFFVSLEDDLMRLFGGERMQSIMETLGVDEDTPIENRMISSTIESAQRKIEGRNFSIRKNVLQYDDVMNSQREIIYGERNKVLEDGDVSANIRQMATDSISANTAVFLSGDDPENWNFTALRDHYLGWLTRETDFTYSEAELDSLTIEDVSKMLIDRANSILDEKEKVFTAPLMRELERSTLLRVVDSKWMGHIDDMEELRRGIYLRSYGNRDPVIEYRIEGFDMFDAMVENIKEDVTRMMLTVHFSNKPIERKQVARSMKESRPTEGGATPAQRGSAPAAPAKAKPQPIRVGQKIGPNDPCPCGSGKKYKKCCMYKDEEAAIRAGRQ